MIGMSAEIRDVACRLFTRCFGIALNERTPLLAAAIAGRREALRSNKVPKDTVRLGPDPGRSSATTSWARSRSRRKRPARTRTRSWAGCSVMRLPINLDPKRRVVPPLCGATEILDGFAQLMSNDSRASALLIYAQPPTPGRRTGKRRTIAEVAAAAVRAGHILVLVIPSRAGCAGTPRPRPGWPTSSRERAPPRARPHEAPQARADDRRARGADRARRVPSRRSSGTRGRSSGTRERPTRTSRPRRGRP